MCPELAQALPFPYLPATRPLHRGAAGIPGAASHRTYSKRRPDATSHLRPILVHPAAALRHASETAPGGDRRADRVDPAVLERLRLRRLLLEPCAAVPAGSLQAAVPALCDADPAGAGHADHRCRADRRAGSGGVSLKEGAAPSGLLSPGRPPGDRAPAEVPHS